MISRYLQRTAVLAAALSMPLAAHAQLGKLGKKLGKAIGQEVAGKPASSSSSSAPVLTAEMLDAFLVGIAVEAGPRMQAKQRHDADIAAYDAWRTRLDSLNGLLAAEYLRANSAALQCSQAASADPGLMQLNMQMAEKLQSMSEADRARVEAKMERWGEKMQAAYRAKDLTTVASYTDSVRTVLGVDITTASVNQHSSYQQCLAKQQSAAVDPDRIVALQTQVQQLSQNAPREPRGTDLEISQEQRDSLRVLGIRASGLSASDYAWAREQSWAFLAARRRDDHSSSDKDWLAMMRAREAELLKYEFVIVEN